ncbi:recQ-mediated genome instability protein 1 isoform X2 [Folsomia candida]|nr:recQ-mediated genome instability protein 1 isoform X2 [Folsomia candida]
MNSIQDIGESAYNQWKKIRQLENENINVTGAATNTDNQWAPKPKRCLYLTLSDGIQLVYGLELTPISCLSLNLRPGVKILFMGPIECRRGVLQLRPVNVKVIGGEVEGIFDSHSVEAVLSSRLNIPRDNIDPAPTTTQRANIPAQSVEDVAFPDTMDDDDDQFFMEIDENLLLGSDHPPNPRTLANSSLETQLIDIADANTEIINTQDFRNMIATQSNNSNTRQNRSSNKTVTNSSSFPSTSLNSTVKPPPVAIKASINGSTATRANVPDSSASKSTSLVKMLGGFQTAKNVTNSSKKPKGKQLKIDGYMKPMPVIIKPATPPVKPTVAVRKVVTETVQPLSQPKIEESSIILVTDGDEDGDMSVIEDDSVVAEMDTDEENAVGRRENTTRRAPRFVPPIAASTPITTSKSKSTGIVHPTIISTPVRYPIMVPGRPYIYIKQIKENLEHWINTGIKSVNIKACVATLISNIRVENGVWTLSVSLNDGTGFLNCTLSPELLNTIIGFDPAEMKRLKSMKTQTAREKIAQGMKELTEQLVLLNAIVEIELCSPDPIILNFTDVSILHVNAIKYRISALK